MDLRTKQRTLARLAQGVQILEAIESFADVERTLLRGVGLSPNTYRPYLGAVRSFYEFMGNAIPVDVMPADIERRIETIAPASRPARGYGLKKFYANLTKVTGLPDPFDDMDDRLHDKIFRGPKHDGPKDSMTANEAARLIAWLDKHRSELWHESTAALVRFLLATGLRAAEACSLTWGDLERKERPDGSPVWVVHGVGKGNRKFTQEIADPGGKVVPALRYVFRRQHRRNPRPSDALLWSLHDAAKVIRPLSYCACYRRIVELRKRQPVVHNSDIAWTPHMLRRTAGTILSDAGMPLVGVSAFLRHRNIQTTAAHYVRSHHAASEYMLDFESECRGVRDGTEKRSPR